MPHTTLRALVISFILLISITSTSYAFYVIPIPQKIQNVVTVAKSGGNYTNVQSAIDSITDASSSNPYLVYIGPGVYTVATSIKMKEWVSIAGSGEKTTILKGANSNPKTSVLSGSDNTTLEHLSVVNEGAGLSQSIAIFNNGVSPVIQNVTATASGGSSNSSAISNYQSASPVISNVTATASGSDYSYAIVNYDNCSPTMTNVIATASGATIDTLGVHNSNYSSPIMTNIIATASGGTYAAGVHNNNSSSPTLSNVIAKATGASSKNLGVWNIDSSSTPIIRNSILQGDSNGIENGSASLSTIIGGGDLSSCSLCVDENGTTLDSTCNIPSP